MIQIASNPLRILPLNSFVPQIHLLFRFVFVFASESTHEIYLYYVPLFFLTCVSVSKSAYEIY